MDIFDEVAMDKTAWAEQKKAQREETYAMIDTFLDELPMEESNLRQYLSVQARFPNCSVSNAVLIAAQRPDATEYHTFSDWKKAEVSVGKGEQGFSMLVPNGTYTGRDGRTHTSYDVQKVFDIAQTSAQREPKAQDVRMNLKSMLMRPVCPIQVADQQNGAVFVPEENRIAVGRGMTMEDTMQTLSIALAHGEMFKAIPDYKPGEARNSFYARCASYIVCARFGVEPRGYSFLDMQTALGPCNAQEMKNHLTVIRAAAYSIIDKTEKARTAMLSKAAREQDQGAR